MSIRGQIDAHGAGPGARSGRPGSNRRVYAVIALASFLLLPLTAQAEAGSISAGFPFLCSDAPKLPAAPQSDGGLCYRQSPEAPRTGNSLDCFSLFIYCLILLAPITRCVACIPALPPGDPLAADMRVDAARAPPCVFSPDTESGRKHVFNSLIPRRNPWLLRMHRTGMHPVLTR